MTALSISKQAQKTPIVSVLTMILLFVGLVGIGIYGFVSLDQSQLAVSYYENSKAVRDAAPAGSEILGTLATLKARQAWLEPLTFTGLSLIIFGIALSFAIAILQTLKMRLALTGVVVQQYLKR